MSQRARSREAEKAKLLSGLNEELPKVCATKIASVIRTYLQRCRLYKRLVERFEKIYDPIRKRYYYYDRDLDVSSWWKPVLLRNSDLPVAPTYTEPEACVKIQGQIRRKLALKRVRLLYQTVVKEELDVANDRVYYQNPKTGYNSGSLPSFMNGRMDYSDKEPEDSDKESDANSYDTETRKERRRAKRKYPRSKIQLLMDAAEDDPQCYELNLSHLGAPKISSRLYDITSLESLSLRGNYLTHIKPDIQYLSKLQVLDIRDNWIHSVPKSLGELSHLRTFLAGHNLLRTFSGFFYKNRDLVELDLSYNLFTELPIQHGNIELLRDTNEWEVGIGLLTSLTNLNLSHNMFTEWPKQLERLTILQIFNMSHNRLSAISPLIASNSGLTSLDLSFNRLESLPSEIYDLPLEHLLVNDNLLTSLPPCDDVPSHRMQNIITLNISNNSISHIPSFGLFISVEKLYGSKNKISLLDAGVGVLLTMTVLDLSYNEITEIPQALGWCKNLEVLDLSHNTINELPVTFSQLKSLQRLHLQHNKLTETPQGLGSMAQLTSLDLSHNTLTTVAPSMYALKSLEILELHHNSIASLDNAICQLTKVKRLDISNNQLTKLPAALSALKELEHLDLSYNNIEVIPFDISGYKALKYMHVDHNNLTNYPRGTNSLKHWNFSWNKLLIGNYVDWEDVDHSYNMDLDVIPMETLRRKLSQTWLALKLLQDSPVSSVVKSRKKGKKKDIEQLAVWHGRLKAHLLSYLSSDLLTWLHKIHDQEQVQKVLHQDIDIGMTKKSKKSMKNIEEALVEPVVSKLPEPSSYYLYQEKLRNESQYSGLLGHTLALDKKFLLEYIPIPLHVKYETPGGGKEVLLTRLNLGCEYQPIIQQFITYAHEIRVIATDFFMKYKEKESKRRENARIRAQNALKRRQPSEKMSRKVLAEEIEQDKEPSVSLAQELWKSKRENSMLQLAMGADTSKPDSFDKNEISNFDDFPTIMHQVRSIGYNNKLLSLLLDTYLGLGSVLMLRADLYAQAIRDLERGSQLNYSVLTISQRWNGDVEDLIDDVYAEMMGESDKREAILKKLADKRQQASNLLARTETMKVEGEDEYMLPLDDEAAVEETKSKGASKGKKTEQKKAVDTTVVDAADDVPDEGFPTISKDDAVTCIEYLVQIRTHILAWAFKVLDAVSDILHELGCDAIDIPKDDSYFTLTSGISQYRNHIIRFYYVRARCLQSLRKFKEAMALYQACINLSKNRSIRKYRIERIKCLLELKELKEARDMITELIYDEISSPYDPFPKVLDILKANKEFGTWFLYIDVYEAQFKRAGMYDNLQHLTYQVNDLGLLTQPPDRLYFDQANGYRPVHRLIKESIIRAEEKKIADETEAKDRQVVHYKASNVHKKYQKILAETKAELNVYLEMEQKEQAESTSRINVKKGKK